MIHKFFPIRLWHESRRSRHLASGGRGCHAGVQGITGRPSTEDVLVNIEAAERSGAKLFFRNALIADLLHRITFIEKAGTGINRMREDAREQDCPAPIFEENGFFTAIFRPNPEVRAQAGAKEGPSTPQTHPGNRHQVGTK